jgi:O-antigen/teichoic acid export membrane protein
LKKTIIDISISIISNGWLAGINFIFTPIFLKILGPEGYGLVGIYTTLYTALILFDFGLSTSLNKELALLSYTKGNATKARSVVRKAETISWIISIIMIVFFIISIDYLSMHWIKSDSFSFDYIKKILLLVGISLFFQLPINLYTGGLYGLQRYSALSILNIISTSIRYFGAFFVLKYHSNDIIAFFYWQIFSSIFNLLLVFFFFRRALPKKNKEDVQEFYSYQMILKIAGGIGVFSVGEFLLGQIDKVILTKLISLEIFGYFMTITTFASATTLFIRPLGNVAFPKLSILANHSTELKKQYFNISNLMAILICPFIWWICFYSREIILLWSKNSQLADQGQVILQFLIVGNGIYALNKIPAVLSLAKGQNMILIYQNFVSSIILIIIVLFLTPQIGVLSGAIGWGIVNLIFLSISVPIIHKKIFDNIELIWFYEIIIRPNLTVLVIYSIIWFLGFLRMGFWFSLLILVLNYIILIFQSRLMNVSSVYNHIKKRLWKSN